MTEATLYDFPKLYDSIVRTGPCEAFYRDLACQTGGPVLELACGTGRLTIPLARDGHDVVGLDASSAMLRSAKIKTDGLDITFVHSDMRDFDLGRRFPLIILSCNSLAHLTSNEDLKAGLACMAKHLAPGGCLRSTSSIRMFGCSRNPTLSACASMLGRILLQLFPLRNLQFTIQFSKSGLHNGACWAAP
jgi:2-polyprenyl-3-methyl-5-hydroxy-6-metoxy-1,4-benzoquinol methylase